VSDDSGLGSLFVLAVLVGGGIYIYNVGYDEAWYSWQYDVPSSNVRVSPKPRDCDFITAPLGAKNCHYKPHVSVLNAAVRQSSSTRSK
jgi:hypothetical protein